MRFFYKFINEKKGSSTIEFALVIPIFFSLLVGMVDLGLYFKLQSQLERSVTRSAEIVSTFTDNTLSSEYIALISQMKKMGKYNDPSDYLVSARIFISNGAGYFSGSEVFRDGDLSTASCPITTHTDIDTVKLPDTDKLVAIDVCHRLDNYLGLGNNTFRYIKESRYIKIQNPS